VLELSTRTAPEPVISWAGLPIGLGAVVAIAGLDAALGSATVLVGVYAIAPFLAASTGGPRATAVTSVAAIAAAAASGMWNDNTGSGGWVAALAITAAASLVATFAARANTAARIGMSRLRLLDRVGRIADGSLPLAETLDRVTEAAVPAFADLCMVDAIRDGDVRRIAVRASGDDAAKIEEHIRKRIPSTPDWLRDPSSESLDPHFVPAMPDEVLRQMANDAEDLTFLRWLRANSYIVAPLVSRGRSLGALTVVRLRRSPALQSADVGFVTSLASRIAIALDNSGLFSDLESIERRMDSVMESVVEAVIVHDAAGKLVYANPAAAELGGFDRRGDMTSAEPGLSNPRWKIRDEAGEPLDPEVLPRRRALRGEDPTPMMFHLFDSETGRESWGLEKSTPIRAGSGDVLYAVTTIEDVTAVKQDEFEQTLLADAAEALASAPDYRSALESFSQTVVPRLADRCSLSVPTPRGGIERIAAADHDPAMLERDRRLREGQGGDPLRSVGLAEVLRTGRPLVTEFGAEQTPGWALLEPITAADETIGVLCLINRAGRRPFSSVDKALAQKLAWRAGVALLNAKLASERAEIAETLQRELLPPLLPEVSGWSMAAMYRPAGAQNRAGGDFYDVFEGRQGWVVVLGDVQGHGAKAAALTAMVRYTIRTAAMLEGDILAALDLLNAELRSRDDPRLCSAVCVSFGSQQEATVVSAGHPLPLLVSDAAVREVGRPGSLLGALEDPHWSPARFEVSQGDELVIYTDGVIEAGRAGERFGRERLDSLLRRTGGPGDTVQRVGEALDAFAETIQDDAALLVLRRERESRLSLALDAGGQGAAREFE
jgi:PAS domain S-box-containing protein